MRYEPSPKHKEPWQPGRKGSLCPAWSQAMAKELLETSIAYKNKRFATREGVAFAGQEHAPGRWHGYPVGWVEVPQAIRQQWLTEGAVTKQRSRKYWQDFQESARD